MAFSGGSPQEITYNHPTLGSGSFSPKSAEEATIDRGGKRSNDDANSITANGQNIDIIEAVRWSFEVMIAHDMLDQDTLQVITDMAGSTEPATWTFTMLNGTVYRGTGKPVGDIQGSSSAQGTLKVSGGGVLAKI